MADYAIELHELSPTVALSRPPPVSVGSPFGSLCPVALLSSGYINLAAPIGRSHETLQILRLLRRQVTEAMYEAADRSAANLRYVGVARLRKGPRDHQAVCRPQQPTGLAYIRLQGTTRRRFAPLPGKEHMMATWPASSLGSVLTSSRTQRSPGRASWRALFPGPGSASRRPPGPIG